MKKACRHDFPCLFGVREGQKPAGRVESGAEHAWVLTREGYGTITYWEVTTGAKYHLAARWCGLSAS